MMEPYKNVDPKARKYIVFKDGTVRTFTPNHKHAVQAKRVYSIPVSAGFYSGEGDKVKVFGWSDSLGLIPKPVDKELLQKHTL